MLMLQSMGLQVSQHVFTVDWPYGGWHNRSCVNMHSILPSPRGDGKESILLVTPLNMQQYHKGKCLDASRLQLCSQGASNDMQMTLLCRRHSINTL